MQLRCESRQTPEDHFVDPRFSCPDQADGIQIDLSGPCSHPCREEGRSGEGM